MRRRLHFAVAALAVAAPLAGATAVHGCSGDPDFESVCLWVADPNNCFRKFLIDQESVQDTCKPQGEPTQVNLAKGDNGVSNGSFVARDKLDVCFISGGGTVTFDPPLDLTKFPAPLLDAPITYKMTFTGINGAECGNTTYVSPHGFSVTINDPTGGTGAGGSGAGGGLVTIVDGGDGGPGKPYGTYTQVIPAGGDAFTATCPNGESHRFNLYEVEGERITDDGGYRSSCPSVDGLVPKAAFVVNPGGIGVSGAASFAIYWPPVGAGATYPDGVDATLDPAGKPIAAAPIVYFNCSIGAAPKVCFNGAKDGAETDVDCGGTEISNGCPLRCGDGQLCITDCDCGSGLACIVKSGTRVCGAGTPADGGVSCSSTFVCSNGRQDGDETGKDCGGSCPTKCPDGTPCKINEDCINGYCNAGLCAASSCTDTVKNGSETDIDCGGTCPKCDNGKTCSVNADCTSMGCVGSVCRVPTCTDTVKDGAETDVDCGGGTCPTCDDSKLCLADGDCSSGICGPAVIGGAINHCFPTSCAGDAGTGSHACGGGNCELCGNDKGCSSNADCISNGCVGNLCKVPTCNDGVADGNETDVDCGGATICLRCASAKKCQTDSDCASGTCFNGLCQ
jgi:hypothetical protein